MAVDEAEVRRTCLALPGVAERLSHRQPAWFAKTLVARMWDDDTLTVKTEEREALAATRPGTFFWTPHHERSPRLVLVRIAKIDSEELADLLEESHRLAGGGR